MEILNPVKNPRHFYLNSNSTGKYLSKNILNTKFIVNTAISLSILIAAANPANALFFSKKNEETKAELVTVERPDEIKNERMLKNLSEAITTEKAEQVSKNVPKAVFVDITGDQVRYDQDTNYFEAIGNAETYLPNKDVTLYADTITFTGKTNLVEAKGNVRVLQKEQSITGEYASFNVDSRTYNLKEPRVFIKGLKLKARASHSTFLDPDKKGKKKDTIHFEDGILALTEPKGIFINSGSTFTRYSLDYQRENRNRKVDWNDLPGRPIFKYSAKEITYDDTTPVNNIKIKGARIHYGDRFSLPVPVHITTTVGERSDSKYIGPIFGTRTRLGGFVMGPRFYHSVDKGTFALAPVVQIGNGPKLGGGAIASFNSPNDSTVLMGGYGSLEDRVIARAEQKFPLGFKTTFLKNQFITGGSQGTSQIGTFLGLSHKFRIKPPVLIDKRSGIRFYNDIAYAKDNDELFSARRLKDFLEERDGSRNTRRNFQENNDDLRVSSNVSFYTEPLLRYGNELYNLSLRGTARNSLRFYGNGDTNNIGRFGPALEFRAKRLQGEVSFLQSITSGQSPFLFDQFVGGSSAVLADGDYKVNEWVSIGGFASYNLNQDRFSRLQLRTDFGPSDFKLRLSYDSIRNQAGFGLNMIFGDPVEYDKLLVKI